MTMIRVASDECASTSSSCGVERLLPIKATTLRIPFCQSIMQSKNPSTITSGTLSDSRMALSICTIFGVKLCTIYGISRSGTLLGEMSQLASLSRSIELSLASGSHLS